jgi:predicted HicB family RNase H-like nuclease
LAPAGYWKIAGVDRSRARLMKKPNPKAPTAAIRARMKPSVKAMAEQLAQKDAGSLADWLERLIAAEAARRDGKK